jgi:sugar transferase (PEP-CTERM system associated)
MALWQTGRVSWDLALSIEPPRSSVAPSDVPAAVSPSGGPPPPRQAPARFSLSAWSALWLLDLLGLLLFWPALLLMAVGWPRLGQVPAVLLFPAAQLLFLFALGLYRRDALIDRRLAMARVPVAALLGVTLVTLALWLLPTPLPSARMVGAALLAALLAGWGARVVLALLRRLGRLRTRVLVIGAGARAWDLWFLMRHEGREGVYEAAFVHGPGMGEADPRMLAPDGPPILPAAMGFLEAARRFEADQIVVAADERRGMPITELLACRTSGYPVIEYMRFLEREIGRIDMKRLELGWLIYADGFRTTPLDRALKRALDVAASLCLLILAAPALLAAALAIRLQDGGPVLYRQNRVTQGGRVFQILKLRTMTVAAESGGAQWAAAGDARVTRVGRFLRRTRIDELPQLINILRGDMAFVGPRPERPEFTRELAAQLPLYEERHRVKAGLTGWAQVNYPYGASLDDARSKLSYDLYYVKNQSLLLDLMIILQTLRVVLWPGTGVR